MNSIELSIVPISDSVKTIIDFIQTYYHKEDFDLETILYNVFDKFKEDLWVVIEYPYVDRVYRDSYYTYFASKHNSYPRDCIRVSFFASKISSNYFRSIRGEKRLKKSFRGFLIIRPTFSCPIGRSLLDRRVMEEENFVTCHYTGNISLNGVKLNVNGFPHSSQDAESISCAETTIWGMMEYFGNRYPDYKPTYPSHIIEVLNRFSKKRLLPSNGLTVDQISFALKEFGFGTNIYAREEAFADIENIIAYYVESGIPIIAVIENTNVNHAILIIGHEIDSIIDISAVNPRELEYPDEKIKYIDYTDIPKKFIVNDDNLPPYQKIELGNPAVHYTEDMSYDGCIIESIVVPLYKKVYLEVTKAKELALAIISDINFGHKFEANFVFRFFLTSSRSFKEHISRLASLAPHQKDFLILTRMPKFIWCAEIYQSTDIQHAEAKGLVILDATEANKVWIDSLIFAGYPDRIILKNKESFIPLHQGLGSYHKFNNNLD